MARPRVFISTDMQLITGVNEVDGDKDDVQSLVHALMYQDKINIVGIASTVSKWQPGANDERFIHHVIDEYGVDHAKLAAHGQPGEFKTAAGLHAVTYQGTKSVVTGVPEATEASAAIIGEARAAKAAGEPLYVVTWGSTGDIARALYDAPDIADAIRLISSAGSVQGSGPYKYILNTFAGQKGFWWIDVNDTLEGVFASENDKYPLAVSLAEVKEFADGHGNLGTFFFENSQDLRGAGGSYSGMKMGDSPGIPYLIDQANNDYPTSESWGGEYRQVGTNHWTDLTDQALNFSESNGARTIYEDRAAWLGDFKARFGWLSGEAPSPPPTDPAPTEPGPVEPAPTEPVPVDPTPPEPTPVDPALDTITVRISGTEYKGDPNFALLVDGKTVDTTNLVTAEHKTGQWQTFTFTGDFDAAGTQSHSVGIKFTNDRYNRDAGDRNLYVDEVTFNDQVNSSDALLTMNGAKSWDFVL